jgi:hypothetical protein
MCSSSEPIWCFLSFPNSIKHNTKFCVNKSCGAVVSWGTLNLNTWFRILSSPYTFVHFHRGWRAGWHGGARPVTWRFFHFCRGWLNSVPTGMVQNK